MPRETIASLRAERDALLEEVARLRAAQASHVCAQPTVPTFPPAAPPCTCGTSARCMKHWPNEWQTNVRMNTVAGCAGGNYPQVLTFPNTVGGNYPTYQLPPSAFIGGAAGGGVAQQVWFNVGGECG